MITPLLKLVEGEPYVPGADEFVILEENSIEEILAHLLSECQNDRDELITVLGMIPDQPRRQGAGPLTPE